MKTCFICGEKYDETKKVAQEFKVCDGTTVLIKRIATPEKTMALCPKCFRPYVYGAIQDREADAGFQYLYIPQNVFEEDQIEDQEEGDQHE